MFKPLAFTYSTWPIDITKEQMSLSTYAVFYDRIDIPYPYFFSPETFTDFINFEFRKDQEKDIKQTFDHLNESYTKWRNRWDPLFKSGNFQHLDPISKSDLPDDALDIFESQLTGSNVQSASLNELSNKIFDLCVSLCVILNSRFAKKHSPELFVFNQQEKNTDNLINSLVNSLFQVRFPIISDLHPDQILEVRDRIKDTKEGFTAYLYGLVDDIENRIASDDISVDDASLRTVERKIMPNYLEFVRKISSMKTGFWSNVLARGGKFLQIDAAPWTPKFYGQILEILLGNIEKASSFDLQGITNQAQAFNYLASIESQIE